MVASYNGHADTVKLLIDKGVDVNAKTKDGYTALMLASQKGHTDIVKLLKQAGAKEQGRKNRGERIINLKVK